MEKIDLEYRVGDDVLGQDIPLETGKVYTITAVNADGTLQLKCDDEVADHVLPTCVKFACHNHGAPFEKFSFDPAKTYVDGYFSGLKWGLLGQIYAAGGPGLSPYGETKKKLCRHQHDYQRLDTEMGEVWKHGWRDGQAESENRRSELVPERSLRLRFGDGDLSDKNKPVTVEEDGGILKATYDGKTYSFTLRGGPVDGSANVILEYDDRPDGLTRDGYALFGADHTSLFSTLEGASQSFNTRLWGGLTSGRCILRVSQVRKNGHSPWKTVKVEGPIEPVKVPNEKWTRVDAKGNIHTRIKDHRPTDFFVVQTFSDEGEVTNVRMAALKEKPEYI